MAQAQQAGQPNREQPPGKKSKPKVKQWHVANTKFGMGDYYGTGIKQSLGRMRDSYTPPVNATPKAKLKKPPRNLA